MSDVQTKQDQILSSFSRIEDKFIAPVVALDSFLALISSKLEPSYVENDTKFTMVQSLYFDSINLDFFQHHFEKRPMRAKIRTRRYGPNGIWNKGVAFLEAKYKANGISQKQRFLIPNGCYESLLANKPLIVSDELLRINSNSSPESLMKRIQEIQSLMDSYSVRPKMNIEYKRLAFESNGIRVTIDRNLTYKVLNEINVDQAADIAHRDFWGTATGMRGQFNNQRHFLIEIKHAGNRPAWFDEFMNDFKIPESSFSKYCWGTTQMIDEAVRSSAPVEVRSAT